MNSSSGPQEGTQEPVAQGGSSAAPHQAALVPQRGGRCVLATVLHGQEHAVTPNNFHMGSWDGKGHAPLSPILYSTGLLDGQEVSQLDLGTWVQAWGEAIALPLSISPRLGMASSIFSTMRVRCNS